MRLVVGDQITANRSKQGNDPAWDAGSRVPLEVFYNFVGSS